MGWSYSYYSQRLHRTFNQGDTIVVQGPAYTSTDKGSVGYNYTTPENKVFYGVFSAEYAYAPVCIGYKVGNETVSQYYIEDGSIVGGGTLESHTYMFNASGGSGAPGNQTKWYGVHFTFPSTIPTLAGHTFRGWANSLIENARIFQAGQTYANLPDTNVEWWAQWQEWTYSVSYNANGGSGAPGGQTKRYTQNLALSSTKPTRSGYTFKHWNTKADGTGTSYAAGGTYSTNANVTLYAIWTANNYTLTVNPNGGSWSGSSSSQSFTQGMNTTRTIINPARTGYTFAGWTISGNGSLSGTTYRQGAGNCTLTAKWNINSYTLTVNPAGGTWNGSSSSQTFNQNYGTTKAVSNPVRAGWRFKGWSLSGSGNISGTTYTYGAGNGTLTAQWERIVYTVTFNASANGGSPNSTRSVNHGDKIGTLPTPARLYYKFVGWFTSASGGTQITADQVITSNRTYYAQYKIDASVTVLAGGRRRPAIVFVKSGGRMRKSLAMKKSGGRFKNSTGSS